MSISIRCIYYIYVHIIYVLIYVYIYICREAGGTCLPRARPIYIHIYYILYVERERDRQAARARRARVVNR
jgi:hypothetical protein